MNNIDNDTKAEIVAYFIEGFGMAGLSKKYNLSDEVISATIRECLTLAISRCEGLTESAKRQNTH